MIFPAIKELTFDKFHLLLEQLPDWHLPLSAQASRHAVRTFRAQAAGEILSGMPLPALPRPPAQPPNPRAALVLWGTYFESRSVVACAEQPAP